MTIIQTKGLAVILILTLGFLLSSSAVVYPIWRGRSLSSFLVLSMAWTFFPYFTHWAFALYYHILPNDDSNFMLIFIVILQFLY